MLWSFLVFDLPYALRLVLLNNFIDLPSMRYFWKQFFKVSLAEEILETLDDVFDVSEPEEHLLMVASALIGASWPDNSAHFGMNRLDFFLSNRKLKISSVLDQVVYIPSLLQFIPLTAASPPSRIFYDIQNSILSVFSLHKLIGIFWGKTALKLVFFGV
jgi:hypothetical protein